MAFSKKTGLFLSAAVCIDVFATGGIASSAGLGIAGILQTLATTGSNIFAGLFTHHFSKEEDANLDLQLQGAFQQAVTQTIESIKKDFIADNLLNTSWWRILCIKYGVDIPSHDENYTLQKSLQQNFFEPVLEVLNDETSIRQILGSHQELSPFEMIEKLIEEKNIQLPKFRKEHQGRLVKALIHGFKDRFMLHFVQNLVRSDAARRAYQTQLLQASVGYLIKIDKNVDVLLDYAEFNKISLLEISQSISEKHDELKSEFRTLQTYFLDQFSLKLITHRHKKEDIRDQFRFDSLYTTFQGRDHELTALSNFLFDNRDFSFYAVSGPGGAGKSRLANEVCLRAESGRWISGFCDHNKNLQFSWASFLPNASTLIVFDYIRGGKEEIADILEALAYSAEQKKFKHKVRILLLERDFDEVLSGMIFTSKTRSHYFTYSLNEKEEPLRLEEMDGDARWEIIEQVVRDSNNPEIINDVLSRKQTLLIDLEKQDPAKRPLFAFFSGVALREGVNINGWNTNDNLKYHLNRLEDKVWSQIDLWKDQTLRTPLRHLIWLAAISEYLTFEDLEKIKELPPFKRLSERWGEESFWEQLGALFRMESIEGDKSSFPGLKPDLLAEYYIITHISRILEAPQFQGQLHDLYKYAWNIKPKNTAWMTWLTITNFLDEKHPSLSHYISWLLEFSDFNSPYVKELFFNLAVFYQERNRLDEAEGLYLKVVDMDHLEALNNLAFLYQQKGKFEKAKTYFLKAIDNGVVAAFHNLANILHDENRLDEAAKYFTKAIDKGYIDSFFGLSILYWLSAKKKEEAWTLMLSYHEKSHSITMQDNVLQLVISAWADVNFYKKNRSNILEKVGLNYPELLRDYLKILHHDYSDFLIGKFETGDLAEHLRKTHPFEYCIVLHFSRPDDPQLKSIPLDAREPFNKWIELITERRKFYSKSKLG